MLEPSSPGLRRAAPWFACPAYFCPRSACMRRYVSTCGVQSIEKPSAGGYNAHGTNKSLGSLHFVVPSVSRFCRRRVLSSRRRECSRAAWLCSHSCTMGCCSSKEDERAEMRQKLTVFFEHEADPVEGSELVDPSGGERPAEPPKRESYAYFTQCQPRHKLCDVAAVACRSCVDMKDVQFFTIKSACESGQVKIMPGDAEIKSMDMFTDKSAFPALCFRVHTKQTEGLRARTFERKRAFTVDTVKPSEDGPKPPPAEDGPEDGPGGAARA
jgi:hypothetical protein